MTLIRAFSEVARRQPDWDLTIYGDGPLRSDLQTLVEQLKLEDRVSLPGTVQNPMTVLAAPISLCWPPDSKVSPMRCVKRCRSGCR